MLTDPTNKLGENSKSTSWLTHSRYVSSFSDLLPDGVLRQFVSQGQTGVRDAGIVPHSVPLLYTGAVHKSYANACYLEIQPEILNAW